MNQRPISQLLGSLLEDLEPLMDFLTASTWAQRQGDPTIADLVVGNPHDDPLPALTDAIERHATPTGPAHFAYNLGDESARRAAAESLQRTQGLTVAWEDVFLTPGTFGAISVALRTVVDPGDEVIYIRPPWFFYGPMIRAAGGEPVPVMASQPDFDLDLDAIAGAISPRTRAILINSPNNPSGRIYPEATLRALGALLEDASARSERRIYLLSDESYARILYDGNAAISPARFYDATLLLYTYGKTLLAPGERLGYIAVPGVMPDREQLEPALLLSQIVGGWQIPNTVMQYALPELEQHVIDLKRLQRRRDLVVDELRGAGYELLKPEGTFYILARSPIDDDKTFVEQLAARDVFVLPGYTFELPGWFRISLTGSDAMIERALPAFREIANAR